MELGTAILIGFIGSFHCIGMCGPIALSLPYQSTTRLRTAGNTLVYNFGRVLTYSFIGLLFGLLGEGIALAGWQQGISIGLGVLLLLAAFSVLNIEQQVVKIKLLDRLFQGVRRRLGVLMRQQTRRTPTLFAVGVLNGFLPCGLVYFAIVGAIGTGSVWGGSLYMAAFGIGTIPLMLSAALLGNLITLQLRRRIQRLIPAMLVAFAVLFILRGLNLDIPYISPKILQEQGELAAPVCH
jgi:uncharacterized protein